MAAFVGAVALLVLASAAVGFVSDDSTYSAEALTDHAWPRFKTHSTAMMSGGRFLPAHFLFMMSLWVPDPTIFRVISIVGIAIASLLFSMSLKSLAGLERQTTLKLASAALLLIQLRTYHDPVLSFGLLIPAVISLNAATVILIQRHKASGSWWAGLAFVFCWTLGLATYELSYGLLPFLLWLALMPGTVQAQRRALIGVVLPAIIVATGAGLTRTLGLGDGSYRGIISNLEFIPVARTFLFQVGGSVPLLTRELHRLRFDGMLALTTALSACLVWLLYPVDRQTLNRQGWGFLALMWVLPGFSIAFSAKYQEEVRWGVAYLPVLLSTFALASALWVFWSLLRTAARRVVALALVVALAVTWRVNIAVGDFVADQFTEPRREFITFIRAVPTGVVSRDDTVAFNGSHNLESVQPGWGWYSWESPEFLDSLGHSVQATLASGWFRPRGGPSVLVGQEDRVLGQHPVLVWYGKLAGGFGFLLFPVELNTEAPALQPGRRWCAAWRGPSNSFAMDSAKLEFSGAVASYPLADRGEMSCFETTTERLDAVDMVIGQRRIRFKTSHTGLTLATDNE